MANKLTINDFRDCGICIAGVKKVHMDFGLDFKKFLKDGYTEEEVLAFLEKHDGNAHLEMAYNNMKMRAE